MASKYETGAVAQTTADAGELTQVASGLRVIPGARGEDDLPIEAATAQAAPAFVGLAAARARSWDADSGVVTLTVGERAIQARLAPEVDPVVIRRAVERHEHLIAQPDGAKWVVLGVLRNCATPGIDVGDDYTIEARRVRVKAEHELTLTAGVARIALASLGRIESIAHYITARATAVHKIIGRAIELN
jgi:hypothetical protein